MKRGRFGLPRPLGLGPLAPGGILYGQPTNSEQMLEAIEEIAEDGGISGDTEDPEEIEQVAQELARRTFPDSERKQERMLKCVESDWGEDWSDGLLQSTGQDENLPLEELSMAASGCRGMVQANTLDI